MLPGGDPILPEMSLARRRPIEPNDVLLLCTDGLWGGLKDEEIVEEMGTPGALREKLLKLGERAVKRCGNGSDNTSAAALRWLGD
jgi:serine/threonine protein phosphatase PrpC